MKDAKKSGLPSLLTVRTRRRPRQLILGTYCNPLQSHVRPHGLYTGADLHTTSG